LIYVTNNDPSPAQGSINWVRKGDPGTIIKKLSPASLITPTGIVRVGRLLYVSDITDPASVNGNIRVYTLDGEDVTSWQPADIDSIEGLSFDGKFLLLTERDTLREIRYTLDGSEVDGRNLGGYFANPRDSMVMPNRNGRLISDIGGDDITHLQPSAFGVMTVRETAPYSNNTSTNGKTPSEIGTGTWASTKVDADYFDANGAGGIDGSYTGDNGDEFLVTETNRLEHVVSARCVYTNENSTLFGMITKWADNSNMIFAWIESDLDLTIARISGGSFATIAVNIPTGITAGVEFLMEMSSVRRSGDNFMHSVSINGRPIDAASYSSSTVAAGTQAGLFLRRAASGNTFTDVRVRGIGS
jgi:hypothetical protein